MPPRYNQESAVSVSEIETDNDGVPDCSDGCKDDATKTELGKCGCGIPDRNSCNETTRTKQHHRASAAVVFSKIDKDEDSIPDCNEECHMDAEETETGTRGCGVAENSTDKDGALDCNDGCSEDTIKTEPGKCGCSILKNRHESRWYPQL